MRLLHAHGIDLVVALDAVLEVSALMVDLPRMEGVEDERNGLFLDVVAFVERNSEAFVLVGPVAGAEAEAEPAAAQDVDEGRVLDDPYRVVEGERHHRRAEPDAAGLGRQVRQIDEGVRQDAVLVGKVVLGDPGRVVAQPVRLHDLAGDARVHGAVRIGLHVEVGLRRHQNTKLHRIPRRLPAPLASVHASVGLVVPIGLPFAGLAAQAHSRPASGGETSSSYRAIRTRSGSALRRAPEDRSAGRRCPCG